MSKILLNQEQISKLVLANKYLVDEKTQFISRCIDGRYSNEKNLPALAIPGADAGELALILAAANVCGLDIDKQKAFQSFVDTVGGVKNVRFHTDSHAKKEVICGGCGYIREIKADPQAFNLVKEDVDFILQQAEDAKKKGAQEILLLGNHEEGAFIIVRGSYGLYTQYHTNGVNVSQVFVFHDSLVNSRHRVLAKNLIQEKAIKTLTEEDQDYLFTILSETTDNHLFEIAKRLAKDLPIYAVNFDQEGNFDLEFQGNIV